MAIKIIRPETLAQLNAVARFERGVSRARKVTHLNECRSFDFFRQRADGSNSQHNTLFISMELLHGKTLGDDLKDGRLDERMKVKHCR